MNIWRIARHELKMTNYDLEEVTNFLFGLREPVFSQWELTKLFNDGGSRRAFVF